MLKFSLLAATALLLPAGFAQKAIPYYTEPSVAPNRAEIAFVSGGRYLDRAAGRRRGAPAGVASGK